MDDLSRGLRHEAGEAQEEYKELRPVSFLIDEPRVVVRLRQMNAVAYVSYDLRDKHNIAIDTGAISFVTVSGAYTNAAFTRRIREEQLLDTNKQLKRLYGLEDALANHEQLFSFILWHEIAHILHEHKLYTHMEKALPDDEYARLPEEVEADAFALRRVIGVEVGLQEVSRV